MSFIYILFSKFAIIDHLGSVAARVLSLI